jgi:hypothetical protein
MATPGEQMNRQWREKNLSKSERKVLNRLYKQLKEMKASGASDEDVSEMALTIRDTKAIFVATKKAAAAQAKKIAQQEAQLADFLDNFASDDEKE